jgi:hypothetical protein
MPSVSSGVKVDLGGIRTARLQIVALYAFWLSWWEQVPTQCILHESSKDWKTTNSNNRD